MRRDIWVFLFAIGVLLFNWPIMSIFKDSLVMYMFIIWFVFILFIFIASIFSEREDDQG